MAPSSSKTHKATPKEKAPQNANKGQIKQRTNNGKKPGTENIEGQGFHTHPERINKKGRPPKLIHHIVQELREQGYQPVTESQIVDAYQMLLQLDENGVKDILKDKKKPYFLRLVAKYMGSPRGMEMLDRIMDRSFGKVMMRQVIDATVVQKPEPEVSDKTRAELLKEVMAQLDPSDKAIIEQSNIDKAE
jgi:NADH dehydrogenase/NADH:ubiquinone oxidoreductase subunit G